MVYTPVYEIEASAHGGKTIVTVARLSRFLHRGGEVLDGWEMPCTNPSDIVAVDDAVTASAAGKGWKVGHLTVEANSPGQTVMYGSTWPIANTRHGQPANS